jgi:hypothetical protein
METEREPDNVRYGDDNGKDVIAHIADLNPIAAFYFCVGNVWKYAKRFVSNSEKAYNTNDINKMLVYAQRAFEYSAVNSEVYVIDMIDYIDKLKATKDAQEQAKFCERIIFYSKHLIRHGSVK